MKQIGVDCTFEANGRVRVRRIHLDGRWYVAGQGRQWVDEAGRHVLVILLNQQTAEIILRADTLCWEMVEKRGPGREIMAA